MKRRRIKKVAELWCFHWDGIKINIKILTYLVPHTPWSFSVNCDGNQWGNSFRGSVRCSMENLKIASLNLPRLRLTATRKSCCERSPERDSYFISETASKTRSTIKRLYFHSIEPELTEINFHRAKSDSISWLSIFSDLKGEGNLLDCVRVSFQRSDWNSLY